MDLIGYEFLRQALGLTAFPPQRPALIKPVTRIEPTEGFLGIPRHVAPETKDPVEHVWRTFQKSWRPQSSYSTRIAT